MKRYTPLIAASLMLAALAPLQTRAAVNTWLNTSADSLWNTNSVNWTAPTIWADGDDAIFGATGAGAVSLSTPVTAHNITVSSADYTFAASGGSTLTLNGTTPTINVGTSNVVMALSLQGTAGLTVQGTSPTNKLTLQSDAGFGLPNQYTGGTFVQSGTLILQASPVPAIRSIDQLDAGATVRYFNDTDGVNNIRTPNGQILLTGQITMTGGTLDLAGDDNQNQVPVPSGTGKILNSSVYSRAVLKMEGNGTTKTFSGVIADGGEVTNSIISGKVSHRLDIDFAGGTGTFVMAGANTFSGSTRIGGGGRTIQLSGAGTLGIPTDRSPAIGVRINGADGDPIGIDLNGTSQRISGMGGNGGRLGNTAVGTISVLTVGKVDGSLDTGTPSWPGKLVDGGGTLAIVKVGTNTQAFAGSGHTYSGDTTVSNGVLAYTTVTAISPNSIIRLYTSAGNLGLSYAGNANVKGLSINGVRMPAGTYGSGTSPIIGTGTITVLPNTWNNGSTDFLWNAASANWTSPTTWFDGSDAIFGATGAGTVTLGNSVSAHNITVSSANYTFASSGGSTLTLSDSSPTIRVGTSNVVLALSLQGTSGLTVQGTSPTNKLTLQSDAGFGLPNQYTGGTFVQSGTLILHASPVPAIRSIDQLDAGATVRYFNDTDGVNNIRTPNGQILLTGQITMTGGTLDLAGDDNQNQVPVPSGTGTILNSSPYSRAVLKMTSDGTTKTFSGVIADGGPVTNSIVSGKVSHRLDIDFQSGSGTFVMAGANTFSGSVRRGSGFIQLSGAGTLGIPTIATPAIGLRINGNDADPILVDLNGTSQRISGMGGNGGRLGNTAVGTTSVLTVGKVDGSLDTGTPGWNGKLVDGGGTLAIIKVGTNTQAFGGTGNTYSGNTTVNDGVLAFTSVTAVSPNTVMRLNTSAGNLGLSYAGTADVHGLYINGVSQPNGVYGSATPPIIGTGFIRVVGNLVASQSGNVITFSWDKPNSKLQAQTNTASVGITGTWFDYPGGGTSPVAVTISPANPTVFFRLAPLP